MGLEKGAYWKLVCDECGDGEGFTHEGIGYTVCDSEKEARETVEDYEGRMEGERVICSECIERAKEEAEDTDAD